ncbi:MAG: SHOCT domain-containing protein [Thermoplasmata archaeon]|nr:MAG: SHOCT domain-containing protein [Thermoplasmata archaeon]
MHCCENHNTKKSDEEIILDLRYARGEITREEYLKMKKDISFGEVAE